MPTGARVTWPSAALGAVVGGLAGPAAALAFEPRTLHALASLLPHAHAKRMGEVEAEMAARGRAARLPWYVRNPFPVAVGSGVAGAALGTLGTVELMRALGVPASGTMGVSIATTGGMLAGLKALMLANSMARRRAETLMAEAKREVPVDPARAERALEEVAGRHQLGHAALSGLVASTKGPYDIGYVRRLARLAGGQPRTGDKATAAQDIGTALAFPANLPLQPALAGGQSWEAVGEAREALGKG